MQDPTELERVYQHYIGDLKKYVPDGIIEVDLSLLQELDLLSVEENSSQEDLTQHFYVVESSEKLTLFNEKFAIWIVPQMINNTPLTYTLIATNVKDLHLQMVFSTSGVYNHSSLVLRILEKFLEQIDENDKETANLN